MIILLLTVCPDHYFYAGDDTPINTKDYFFDEAWRSPTYSCYRMFDEASLNFVEATQRCEKDRGHLVSFEDTQEFERFNEKFFDNDNDDDDDDEDDENDDDREDKIKYFLTSALFLENRWVWMGSSKNFPIAFRKINHAMHFSLDKSFDNSITIEENDYQCLKAYMESGKRGNYSRVSCLEKANFACELRVETVTYFAWFVANWFSVLLVNSANIDLSVLLSKSFYRFS